MASARQQPQTDEIRDPEIPPTPSQEPERVNPMVEGGPTEGVSTMSDLFGKPVVVDEVIEQPYAPMPETPPEWWVIRPGKDIEDMTVGSPNNHFAFKAGVRYRVPFDVAQILMNRDHLIEVPYPYEEQRRR